MYDEGRGVAQDYTKALEWYLRAAAQDNPTAQYNLLINEECVEQAVNTGLGLKAQINLRSIFDRKNYFYPDLPQGYQICQYKHPIVGEGEVRSSMRTATFRSASSGCTWSRTPASPCTTNPDMTFVDLNRSGVA